ncbi:MAG: hypothetical protein JW705_06810 [Methanosarcinaceae archaeon]|nr:hypothetical protein [Methanosarcinaceae archaeon]
MKARSITFFLVVLFMVFAGCVEDGSRDVTELEKEFPQANISVYDNNGSEARTVVVYLENYRFDPYLTTISVGDTVRWVKKDHPAQIIKSNLFQSPTMRKGDTFSFTFNDTGNFDYQILSHPWAPGGIIVVE